MLRTLPTKSINVLVI